MGSMRMIQVQIATFVRDEFETNLPDPSHLGELAQKSPRNFPVIVFYEYNRPDHSTGTAEQTIIERVTVPDVDPDFDISELLNDDTLDYLRAEATEHGKNALGLEG